MIGLYIRREGQRAIMTYLIMSDFISRFYGKRKDIHFFVAHFIRKIFKTEIDCIQVYVLNTLNDIYVIKRFKYNF